MKTEFLFCCFLAAMLRMGQAQGVLSYYNGAAPTRIATISGPLAGTNILAQMFAGSEANALAPIGPVDFHIQGIVHAGNVAVPGVAPYTYAYVQLLAWDGSLWGTDLSTVPTEQIGRTDVVSIMLRTDIYPDFPSAPRFTSPAIVPIPEPAVLSLGEISAVVLLLCRRFLLGARRLPRDG